MTPASLPSGRWRRTRDLADSDGNYHVVVDRVYNSLASDDFSILSPRWGFDVGPATKLAVQSNGDALVTGPSGYRILFAKQANGAFKAPIGFDGSLVATSSGWTLSRTSQGDQFGFNGSGQLAWTKDSQARDFTVQGTSAAGRDVLSSYGTNSGRRVNLSYNGDSLVREMDDPSSGHHYYGYTIGKLTSYRNPSGAETTYHYAANGYLDKITEAGGTTVELTTTPAGRVQSITTTLPGAAGQTTSFVYTRRAYKTDVTGPDAVRRTYAYDNDYRVTRQYNPDVGPTVTASGDLRDMADQYVNGNQAYSVTIAADEADGAGLTRIGVENNGQEIVGADPPCTDTSFDHVCPTSFSAPLHADLSSLSEGRQTLYGVAVDDEQHRERSAGWNVLVDRTAPPAPGGTDALYDSDDQSTDLSWDAASDPALADGTAGSGTTSYRYRYRAGGGAWSDWATVLGLGDTVSGLAAGQTLTVETQATDAVGNTGPVASATITVGDATLTPDNVGDSLSSEDALDPDADAIIGEPASWSTADPDGTMGDDEDAETSSRAAADSLLSSSDGAFSLNLCGNGSPCGKYNGAAAAAYAHAYYNKRNKDYRLFEDDCTNFVSQALHFGDMHFLRTRNGVNDPQGPKHPAGTYVRGSHSWWSEIFSAGAYKNTTSWSVSWILYNQLLDTHLASIVPKSGHLRAGDVVFYRLTGGQIDHAQIVSKVTSKRVIVAQHSRNYEHSLKWVTKTSIPRNKAWKNFTYTVVRPKYTMINIAS